ncbi:MAG: ribosome maturation factor RimP [Aridibacter sp.]
MNKSERVERIREIAENVAEKQALELVHVELAGTGKQQTVRIFIDNDEGITHEDCAFVSQEVDKQIETEDLIKNSFVLEVSSPGIERGLYKLEDFEKFAGENAKVKTIRPINGQRNFEGEISGVEGQEILLDDKTNGNVQVPFEAITKANLKVDFEKELKRAKRKS